MTVLQGDEVEFSVYRGGAPVPVACFTSVTLELTQEMIAVATIDSGVYEDFEPGFEGCTVTAEGVTTFDDVSKWQFREFLEGRRTKKRIVLDMTDSLGNTLSIDMWVLLEGASISNSVDDFSMSTVTLRRCGPMAMTFNGAAILGIGAMVIGSTFIIG